MIITTTNRKGGSGKTALAVNLAACYSETGRCLLIDLDTQADASNQYGIEDSGGSLAEALAGKASLDAAIRETAANVDVVPAGEALGRINESVRPDILRRLLESVRHRGYSTVIIDCAPALDSLTAAAWQVSDIALVPVDGPAGLRGVAKLRHAFEDLRLDSSRIRVVLTRYDGRRVLDRTIADQARGLYGEAVLESKVRESIIVSESAAWRVPLVLHAPAHRVTDDFRRLAREIEHG